jgi:hypothetical protein
MGGKARGEQDFDARAQFGGAARQSEAVVLTGHDDVGEQDVNGPRLTQQRQRLVAASRRDHLIAERPQLARDELANVLVVFDQENNRPRSIGLRHRHILDGLILERGRARPHLPRRRENNLN